MHTEIEFDRAEENPRPGSATTRCAWIAIALTIAIGAGPVLFVVRHGDRPTGPSAAHATTINTAQDEATPARSVAGGLGTPVTANPTDSGGQAKDTENPPHAPPPQFPASARMSLAGIDGIDAVSGWVDGPHIVPAGRSPLLQPGESMSTPIPSPLLQEPAPAAARRPAKVIRWHEAARHVGEWVTVEGKIVKARAYDSKSQGRLYFLNYVEDWRDKFYVVVFEEAASAWPQPPHLQFLNRTIRVNGKVQLHRQTRLQITVRRADQISVIEGK